MESLLDIIYMTKHESSASPELRDRPEIEITPAMAEAGAAVLIETLGDDVSNYERARLTFAAMLAAYQVREAV